MIYEVTFHKSKSVFQILQKVDETPFSRGLKNDATILYSFIVDRNFILTLYSNSAMIKA